jgi:hypothetical protein
MAVTDREADIRFYRSDVRSRAQFLGGDRDFQDAIPLVAEELIGLLNLIEFEAVGNQRLQVYTVRRYDLHQTPHRSRQERRCCSRSA